MSKIVELSAAGLEFTCRVSGDPGGQPVILLHGCPETSAMWHEVMPKLAESGYYCLAPDQRGYSAGARPAEVSAYGHRQLGEDVLAIATSAGFERFHLVAHDWGAGAGWCALDCDKDKRIASYVSLSIPHYRAFALGVRDDPEQTRYREFLRTVLIEGVIEEKWKADNFAALRAIWKSAGPELTNSYLATFSQPGAIEAVLNWYRATDGHMRALDGSSLDFGPVDVPTLLIWGSRDPSVKRRAIEMGRDNMVGPYEYVELDAGHWLVQEEGEIIVPHILRHLRRHRFT